MFHRELLLTKGGKSNLEQLIAHQWVQQRELENVFYKEYRAFREKLYETLVEANPNFPGTKGRLVRLSQKILDRCIFIFFCEDMGSALNYPPQLLRNLLINDSRDEFYDPNENTIWARLKSLFTSMNEGSPFRQHKINQFNGGLFAEDAELNSLEIPNQIFCVPGQGENEASLYSHKETLLYLSAAYNYASESLDTEQGHTPILGDAAKNDPSKSLGLYTLGRIFEQSITELEILEAKADGLLSVNEESKRKRDGVFYTPEWVVEKVVHHTVAPLFDELKANAGWPTNEEKYPTPEAINAYREELRNVRIVDPACGSGAFLITALRYLVTEWHALRGLEEIAAQDELKRALSSKKGVTKARRRLKDTQTVRDDSALINDILKENIYGVDINPASVEISRLALWLHTARGDKPLSSLEGTIKTGNSLIGPDFYEGRMDLDSYDAEQRDRINAFDWQEEFSDVFASGGFDAVVGNPPYVKLQNFRKVHADMAVALKVRGDGSVAYESTQTGNFDLYLPFIEQGLRLLNERGRMGYICPSLWEMNKYGSGLRGLIERGRNLEGWINFRAFQVFDEAITYCALQFFSKRRNEVVKIAMAVDGEVSDNPWPDHNCELPFEKIGFEERWLLLTGPDRQLIDDLYERCEKLSDYVGNNNISQGIISGAFPIFSLRKKEDGSFLNEKSNITLPKDLPLVLRLATGEHIRRFEEPDSDLFIIFPYDFYQGRATIVAPDKFPTKYPDVFNYLEKFESDLRKRDSGGLDKPTWYEYSRTQNLNKQQQAKLLIAGTAPGLRVSLDNDGSIAANDKRVYTITSQDEGTLLFLLGVLNSKAIDFVFRRIARPKVNNFFDIEKQFLAPLPIPTADDKRKENIAAQAKTLQKLTTKRRDMAIRITKRGSSLKIKKRPLHWLFPDLPSLDDLEEAAPQGSDTRERKAWAKTKLAEAITAKHEEITGRLNPTAELSARFKDGELSFFVDHVSVVSDVWLDDGEGTFIAAQWSNFAATFNITEKSNGKQLCDALLKVGETDNTALRDQIIKLQGEMAALDIEIAAKELALDQEIFDLYQLTDDEIEMIEQDRL